MNMVRRGLIQQTRRHCATNDIIYRFKKNLNQVTADASRLQVSQDQLVEDGNNRLLMRIAEAFFKNEQDLLCYRHQIQDDQPILPARHNCPQRCFTRIVMPFSTNDSLRLQFQAYANNIRTGRLLELLDYLAVEVSNKFCAVDHRDNRSIVTVCVDNMQFFGPLEGHLDLTIDSYVTHTGNTTIEVRTDLLQNGKLQATAIFLMASRDHLSKTSVPVPSLTTALCSDPDTAHLRYELGLLHQNQRKNQRNYSVFRQPPSADESIQLHKLFMLSQEQDSTHHYVCISDTQIEKYLIMHLQDRNMHGNVFGGYIMRQAYELGWLCAVRFLEGRRPHIYHIDDVLFTKPVSVGSIIKIDAKVVFTQGRLICTCVTLFQLINTPQGEHQVKTTELHLQFIEQDDLAYQIKTVQPQTYENAMFYLEGKRRLDGHMSQWQTSQ